MASLSSDSPSKQSSSSQSVTEYVVRVPRNPSKRYNLMDFNAADKVDISTWKQARMVRDLSAKKMYQEEELPESGAGSEYKRKQREEAKRKKRGIILKEFKKEDQPWILRVNGKAGRKFRGVKKGGVTENASYFIFTQCPDGAFEAFPVSNWYKFTLVAKHRTLTAEEAETEYMRREKVLNHFTIMQQRRLKGQGEDDDDEEEGGSKQEKGGKRKKKKIKSDLKICDRDEDLDSSSSESEESGEDGEHRPKLEKPAAQSKKMRKDYSNNEPHPEDSDDGDFEGMEVDYMSDDDSSSDEEPDSIPAKEEGVPKGIDEKSESSEESEEEKVEEEEDEEEKPETQKEAKKKRKYLLKKLTSSQEPKRQNCTSAFTDIPKMKTDPKKGHKGGASNSKWEQDSSDESDTSEESDIDGEAYSAIFMQKKKTPPKKDLKGGSNNSSRGNSRPGTSSPESANTLKAAASKQGKQGAVSHTAAAKRLKIDPGRQNTSGKSTPQPQSGKSTPSSSDIQLTEEAVRRYLTRKPMTTKDLLKKFQTKKTGLSSEQTVNVLAQILKRLNPDRKIVHDKMHFYLKE